LAPVSQTDCHNSQSSPTPHRCKDPERGKENELKKKKRKIGPSSKRNGRHLVWFCLTGVLKGTVRNLLYQMDSDLLKSQIEKLKKKTDKKTNTRVLMIVVGEAQVFVCFLF